MHAVIGPENPAILWPSQPFWAKMESRESEVGTVGILYALSGVHLNRNVRHYPFQPMRNDKEQIGKSREHFGKKNESRNFSLWAPPFAIVVSDKPTLRVKQTAHACAPSWFTVL